jgi:flagellin-like protein
MLSADMEKRRAGNKKGVSPVIATVLLVTMVVVTALIIFIWFRNINKEAITKFDGVNVEVVCSEVKFESSYSDGSLYVVNDGNVPLYSMKMKIEAGGSYETEDLENVPGSNWPDKGLNPGMAFSSSSLNSLVSGADKVSMIPVLIGVNDAGEQKLHTCADNYAQQLYIA